MKMDKLQLRGTIGIIFVLIMYILISILEPKTENYNNRHNKLEKTGINELDF